MLKTIATMFVILVAALTIIAPCVSAQDAKRSLSLSGIASQFVVPQDSIEGEWVGAVEIGMDLDYLQLGIKTEAQGIKITVLSTSMTPGLAGAITDVRLESSRVQFELPRGSKPLTFNGQLQGATIAGTVQHANEQGTFQLMRQAQIDPKLYDDYVGPYELEPNRIVFIRREDVLKQDPPYSVARSRLRYMDESGHMGILYPSSDTTFFSGPTYVVPVPVEVEVTFIRSHGKVSGLLWRERGHPERAAARSKLYRQEEVHFRNGDVVFAGTLLLPSTKGPHPAIVIALGRAANNRNTGMEMADIFAKHGVAALVYDKRGVGGTTGDWRESSFLGSLANDALAATNFLRHRKDINPKQVGLFGSSWTGVVASLAASRSKDLGFLILVASPGLPLGERYLAGWVPARLRANGFSEEDIAEAVAFAKLEVAYRSNEVGWEQLQAAIEKERNKKWFPQTMVARTPGATSKDHWSWREYRLSAVDDHPVSLLRKVTCPVLAIYGDLDREVPPDPNMKLVESALREGRNRDYTVRLLPKGDHGMWDNTSGSFSRQKGYVPGYFETMIEWLLKRVDVVK
jgi:pimeloyl-ACP methyl ester carboxylesterase